MLFLFHPYKQFIICLPSDYMDMLLSDDPFWHDLTQVSFDLLPSRLELLRFQDQKNTLALVDCFYLSLDSLLTKHTLSQSLPILEHPISNQPTCAAPSAITPQTYSRRSICELAMLYKEYGRLGHPHKQKQILAFLEDYREYPVIDRLVQLMHSPEIIPPLDHRLEESVEVLLSQPPNKTQADRLVYLLKQRWCQAGKVLAVLLRVEPTHPMVEYLRVCLKEFMPQHLDSQLDLLTDTVTLFSLNESIPNVPVPTDLSDLRRLACSHEYYCRLYMSMYQVKGVLEWEPCLWETYQERVGVLPEEVGVVGRLVVHT